MTDSYNYYMIILYEDQKKYFIYMFSFAIIIVRV